MMHDSDIEWALVGKTVQGILVSDDQHVLVFATDQGDVILRAEGDCCSECWFAEFLGIGNLLGQRICAVESIDLPDYNTDDGRGRQEYDDVYGYKFTTKMGYADLVYRNSSNGYYGGWLELVKDASRPDGLTAITGDTWVA